MNRPSLLLFVLLALHLLSVSSKQQTEYSIEFQIDMPLELFAYNRSAGIEAIFEFFRNTSISFPVLEMKLENEGQLVHIWESHYDAVDGSRLFSDKDMYLRYRTYSTPANNTPYEIDSYLKFDHKIAWYALASPVQCAWATVTDPNAPKCGSRLEQDIHQNYTRFSIESKITPVPMPTSQMTLAQVAEYYPGVTTFDGFLPETILGPKSGSSGASYFHRTENIGLVVGGYQTDTTIDVIYDSPETRANGTDPIGTELSVRIYGNLANDPPFSAHVVRRTDFLYFLLLNSEFNVLRDSNETHVDKTQWGTFWSDL